MQQTYEIKKHEWSAFFLSFIYYFAVLSAYYVIRPIRDQLAAEVGSIHLPYFFLATFVVCLILTPIFSSLASKWPRRVLLPFTQLFFIVCQLLFIVFFTNPSWISTFNLGLLFFVWVSVFNLFIVSLFWIFMTDIWGEDQARRLFPLIALGGTSGAILGPLLTHAFVEYIGVSLLLLVSAFFLSIALLCVICLGNWAKKYGEHRYEKTSEEAIGGGFLDGLKQVFNNPFIRGMSVMLLLNDAIGTTAYALVTDYSSLTYGLDAIARTRFAATLDLFSNSLQVVVQLTITRIILVKYGPGGLFAFWTAIIVIFSLSLFIISDPYMLIIGSIPFVAFVLIIARSFSFAMLQPARETLYTLVSRSLRYKGKNAVDTVVWRAGDVLSLMATNTLITLGVNVAGFGLIWAFLAASSGYIGIKLSSQVENLD